jgi:hypothetical protein
MLKIIIEEHHDLALARHTHHPPDLIARGVIASLDRCALARHSDARPPGAARRCVSKSPCTICQSSAEPMVNNKAAVLRVLPYYL